MPAPPPVVAEPDPLGERPALEASKPVSLPPPATFKTESGITVWLVERHALPLVSVALAMPAGSSSDPPSKLGLAFITANMLDEGAGDKDAIALSAAINDLGTSLSVQTDLDASTVSMTVLKGNFPKAFQLMADVVTRPRLQPKDYKRVSDLWINALQQRNDDPDEVARVAIRAAAYGSESPYGHPADGFVNDAKRVRLGDVKSFYETQWRPDRAVVVIVGDITRSEAEAQLSSAFGGWKAKRKKAPPAPEPSTLAPVASRPRLVLVDRDDAPQSVIAIVRDGVSARDPQTPLLDLVNTALGGSFTSRLNQNLREDKHWTYGAFSGFTHPRGQGVFVARASVFVDVTGQALKEMLGELRGMAQAGLTQDEMDKVKAQDRADLVQTYETVAGTSERLAQLYVLGLDPSFDLSASDVRQRATMEQLRALAGAHVDAAHATVVIVGPKAQVLPQLQTSGLGEPVVWSAEGRPEPARK